MASFVLPPGYARVQRVASFQELVATPFAQGVNALCWPRTLPGDFAEIIKLLDSSEDILILDAARLLSLPVSPAGRVAVAAMLTDLQLLQNHALAPVLNCIHGYPRDETPGPVPTDVFSFHADSAPMAADTYLCTYYGPSSEGLRNEEAHQKVNLPAIRAELLQEFGGADNADFNEYLNEHCYDLHYAPAPSAQPFSFGLGNLWRIATEWPGSPVPPCIHRAPATLPGQARLLLIS